MQAGTPVCREGVGLGWVGLGPGSRERLCPMACVTLPHRRDRVPTLGCLVSQPPRQLAIPEPGQGAGQREILPCLCVCVCVCRSRARPPGGGGGGHAGSHHGAVPGPATSPWGARRRAPHVSVCAVAPPPPPSRMPATASARPHSLCSFLSIDYAVDCESQLYQRTRFASYAFTAGYGIGIPVMFLVMGKLLHKISYEVEMRTFAFLMGGFKRFASAPWEATMCGLLGMIITEPPPPPCPQVAAPNSDPRRRGGRGGHCRTSGMYVAATVRLLGRL